MRIPSFAVPGLRAAHLTFTYRNTASFPTHALFPAATRTADTFAALELPGSARKTSFNIPTYFTTLPLQHLPAPPTAMFSGGWRGNCLPGGPLRSLSTPPRTPCLLPTLRSALVYHSALPSTFATHISFTFRYIGYTCCARLPADELHHFRCLGVTAAALRYALHAHPNRRFYIPAGMPAILPNDVNTLPRGANWHLPTAYGDLVALRDLLHCSAFNLHCGVGRQF